MTRGRLRIYLGAAPGVGKTYAMLGEGQRRHSRGTNVVVGFVETYGRPHTTEMLNGLEIVPRKEMTYRGASFTELDVEAVIARRPEQALIDELAHTNVPGSHNAKRWEDTEEILDAGIDVISTVNIQHLESLNDVVEQITGITQRETVPDEVVRRADQIELVDMAPEALRRRMAHGNVYPPEKIDAALANYFRIGNLTALRELALLWLADKVDDQLDQYRSDHGIAGTWETRERVLVALTGGSEGDTLIRRAARIANRVKGADLLAVHVARGDGLTGAHPGNLERQRALVESIGGTYHHVVGDDIPQALLDFARGVNATQLVLGASRRGWFAQLFSPGVGVTTTALSGQIDVHMVTHEEVGRRWRAPRMNGGLTMRRRLAGFALAAVGLPLLVWLLARGGERTFPSALLLLLGAVVAVALTGGLYPALLAAVGGFLLLDFFFTEPYRTFVVGDPGNVLALVVFVLVAAGVSAVVDLAARRTRQAARASAEASILSTVAGSVLRGERALTALLEQLRETFGLTSVTLLEHAPDAAMTPDRQRDPASWRIAANVGAKPCTCPDQGEADIPIGDELALVLSGPAIAAADRRILEAFAAQAAVALRQQRLAEEAGQAKPLAEADKMRTALLNAVSHDLRTPLASARAAVESLQSRDVIWSEEEREELLDTAGESLERLGRLVENLLDMSRLQAGAIGVCARHLAVEDLVPLAVDAIDDLDGRGRVQPRIPDDLPEIIADPALVERVLVNVIGNALRHTSGDRPVLVTASSHADRVELRVIDHGPGIPQRDHDRVFQPFQRLGDRDNHTGTGLGLALSRGFTEAMGGSLVPDETPGGGLTMILTLPAAARPTPPPEADVDAPGPTQAVIDRITALRDRTRSQGDQGDQGDPR